MKRILLAGVLALVMQHALAAQAPDLADRLRQLDGAVFTPQTARAKQLDRMLATDIRTRTHAAHQRQAEAFAQLTGKADWERFRTERINALRAALGPLPALGGDLNVQVARTHRGDGYRRDDLVFVSRERQVITANLYGPAKPGGKLPGIVLVHGFHQPKTQGELQDMGVNWAKLGCLVLVPDVLGHGERKQHPFLTAQSYPGKFNLPRQDYYGRANTGLQLSLVGESLMGWMVFDTLRCVDLLRSRPGIDPERIIVLGAVAAGGDVAAVAAALDPRIAGVVPFNFGGPEPETVYPLPAEGAEKTFPYASGHWDGTRRLRNSSRDGFLPWVVVAAAAPRRVVYAHEFAWDRERDPVWPRLEKVFRWYDAASRLASAHGSGTLFGNPEGTGCANIGPVHRQALYPHLARWFAIPAPTKEVQDRRPASEMQCLTPAIAAALKPQKVQQELAERTVKLPRPRAGQALRQDWGNLLGDVAPAAAAKVQSREATALGSGSVERIALEVEPGILVPMLLLLPARQGTQRLPLVVGVAQQGKQAFLKERAEAMAALLQNGVAVCLPDVRGTGETSPAGERRGPPAGTYKGVQASSPSTLLANENLMIGRTLLGDRVRDLRSVLRYLQGRDEVGRVALWGDSFARVNGAEERVEVPWDAEQLPAQAEPLGGLLALLTALYEESIAAVHIRGSVVSYQSLLASPFCHVAPDAIVPGALTAGDLAAVTAALAPRPVRAVGGVDGRNRRVTADADGKEIAAWLTKQLKR